MSTRLMWPSARSGNTFMVAGASVAKASRRSCRRCTRRAWRPRSTGARRRSRWSGLRPGYDNLASAVKQVLRGRRRVESDRFIALRSHYLYESQFTTPGVEGAHEKGGVEGEVGRFRRRHLVPVPDVASLGELNVRMLAGCESDLGRRITGRQETVGESFARQRPLLRALPAERASTAEEATPRVDSKSLATIKQNRYSVPVRLAGLRVHARRRTRDRVPPRG